MASPTIYKFADLMPTMAQPKAGQAVQAGAGTAVGPTVVPFALPGTPPEVMHGRVSEINKAAQVIASGHWFDNLTPDKQNEILWGITRHPLIVAAADLEREFWLKNLFSLADAGHRGATEAHEIALSWSKTSSRFKNEDDFERDWDSFDPLRASGITVGTLIHTAENAGIDLTQWRDMAQPTPPPSSPTSLLAAPFCTPISFDAADLHRPYWIASGLLLREAITLLAGPGGGAKTAFVFGLFVALASGRKQFGPFPIEGQKPGGLRVLYVSAEEDKQSAALLVAAACSALVLDARERARVKHNFTIHDAALGDFDLGAPRPGLREDIAPEKDDRAYQQLAALTDIDVVALDTMAALVAVPENDNPAVTKRMRRITKAARLGHYAVLAVHHVPKINREAIAALRGDPALVRGGGAFANSARSVLTLTPLPDGEAAQFAYIGLPPDRMRRLEHAKLNDGPFMSPAYLRLRSEPVKVSDGGEISVRAVEFVAAPTASGPTNIGLYDIVMRTVSAGTHDKAGAPVPLSPGGGPKTDRDATEHVTRAIMNAPATNAVAVTANQAKALAKKALEELRQLGCISIDHDAQLPKYKRDGQRDGSRKGNALVAHWDRALWAKPSMPVPAGGAAASTDA